MGIDIMKTTRVQKNGMTMLPIELREFGGNPDKVQWITANKEKDGVITVKMKLK